MRRTMMFALMAVFAVPGMAMAADGGEGWIKPFAAIAAGIGFGLAAGLCGLGQGRAAGSAGGRSVGAVPGARASCRRRWALYGGCWSSALARAPMRT